MVMPVRAGETLFASVWLDPANPPRRIGIEWEDLKAHWHQASWGELVPLPAPGVWTRLEMPAATLGLEGETVMGLSLTVEGGRAAFERVGRR
jgi:hypothetical protein